MIVVALYYLLPLYVMVVTSLKGMPEIRLGNIFAAGGDHLRALGQGLGQACGPQLRRPQPRLLELGPDHCAVGDPLDRHRIVNGYALANWRFKGLGDLLRHPDLRRLHPLPGDALPDRHPPARDRALRLALGPRDRALDLRHADPDAPVPQLLHLRPEELFKAARVDGAGFWGIYFKIMLPMALPIFVVAIILQVTGIWNDFLFGVVYTKPDTYPMTVQLNNIVNPVQGVKEYNVNMAATIITGLVPLAIYFISGKLFVRGIAAGAVRDNA